MSLRPYERYKNSGVEWVPVLPSHWRHTQLRRIARIFAGGTPDRTNLDYWTDGTVPWLNSGSVNDGAITQPSEWITEEASSGGRTRWVPARSVLVALAGQGKTKGMAARLEFASTCNQSMAAIVPSSDVDYRFVHLWLNANYQNIRNLAGGDLRDGLNLQHISSISLPLPPKIEQRSIADFLDRETAEIGAFIDDQEELIGLLNERRVATITQAVTKGLNLSAPMKDSGVEWLGEVPDHWVLTPLRHLVSEPLKYGANEAADSDDPAGVRYLRITDFDLDGRLRDETFRSLPVNVATGYMVAPGDVLLARSGATVGKAFIVPEASPPSCFAGYLIKVSTARKKLHPQFFFAYTQSSSFSSWKSQTQVMATIQNIGADRYATLPVPCPPLGEQRDITDYLDRETAEIDAAVADAREAIALSKERRAAVISAAVSGRIDVRGHTTTKQSTVQGEPVGAA